MRAALGAGIAQADEKLERSQNGERRKGVRDGLSLKPRPRHPLTRAARTRGGARHPAPYAGVADAMIGPSAATTRPICSGVSMSPIIFMKRSFCTPETMYCQR